MNKMLTMCVVVAAALCAWADSESLVYNTEPNYQDGGIILTSVASGKPSGTLVIPSTYNGERVTAICDLFYNCPSITKVVFPPTLKRMTQCGFERCPGIKEVVFNEGLEEIGGWAFNDCDAIKSLHIPSTVKIINVAALNCRGVETITVADGNHYFHAANGCLIEDATKRVLTSIGKRNGKGFPLVIPEGVEILGAHALRAASVTDVSFPSTLREIEPCAIAGSEWTATTFDFSRCRNLTTIGDLAFGNVKGTLQEVILPASLRDLGAWVFAGCTNLKSVRFFGPEVSVAEGPRYEDAIIELEEACPGCTAKYPDGDIYVGKDCKYLRNVTTYVQPGLDWDGIVAFGTWQSRPIKYDGPGPEPEEGFEEAHTFNGLVYAGEVMCGIVQVTTGKRTTKDQVKVGGFVMLADGKKQKIKSVTEDVEGGKVNVETKAGKLGEMELEITDNGFTGSVGLMTVRSEDIGEDTGIVSGTLKMSYFDAKTNKLKTRSIKLGGVASGGEAAGTLDTKGEETKTFEAAIE